MREDGGAEAYYPSSLATFLANYRHGAGCVVAEDFQYGANFAMGHYCIIEDGCVVGDDVTLGNFVLLKAGTVIGDRTFLDSYVKSSGNNRIGSDVIVRFNATIAREVTVGDRAFISPNVMTIYSTHTKERRGGTIIGEDCHIGTNAVIGPGLLIADKTVIGALAYVSKDIEEAAIYVGQPAKKLRDL